MEVHKLFKIHFCNMFFFSCKLTVCGRLSHYIPSGSPLVRSAWCCTPSRGGSTAADRWSPREALGSRWSGGRDSPPLYQSEYWTGLDLRGRRQKLKLWRQAYSSGVLIFTCSKLFNGHEREPNESESFSQDFAFVFRRGLQLLSVSFGLRPTHSSSEQSHLSHSQSVPLQNCNQCIYAG